MQTPTLDPDVADTAPSDSVLTVYDEQHVITYLRLLDADAQGANWRDVARIKSGNFAQRVGIVPDPKNPGGPDCSIINNWRRKLGLISGLTRA
jgi:hypothetical protein